MAQITLNSWVTRRIADHPDAIIAHAAWSMLVADEDRADTFDANLIVNDDALLIDYVKWFLAEPVSIERVCDIGRRVRETSVCPRIPSVNLMTREQARQYHRLMTAHRLQHYSPTGVSVLAGWNDPETGERQEPPRYQCPAPVAA